MKKLLLLLTVLLSSLSLSYADSGIFGSYIVLNINGGGNNYTALSAFNGMNLGTFDPGAGDMLVLGGGEVDTFKNGTDNVLGADINYRIYSGAPPSFTDLSEPFRDEYPAFGSNPGDQRWGQGDANPFLTTNLLQGLAPGTYTFEIYASSPVDTTGGTTQNATNYDNNGGANYIATFTIVPEPSILSLLGGSSVLVAFMFLRRRRA